MWDYTKVGEVVLIEVVRNHLAAANMHGTNSAMRTVLSRPTPRSAAVGARAEDQLPAPGLPAPKPTTTMTMSDVNENDLQLLRKEFHAFWSAGLRGRNYLDQSAIVCYLDLDQEEITLTRIFAAGDGDSRGDRAAGEDRAEDLMVDWLQEEVLIQNASSIEVSLYMNYSPLRLTADGLVMVLDELKAMGKKVKAGIKFVELYKTGPGEEDCEENREGLRLLQSYGAQVDVVQERDWLFLMQTLTRGSAKGQQEERNAAARQRLTGILRDPRDEETSTCDCDGDVVQLVREADVIPILHRDTAVGAAKQQTATQCEGQ